MKNLNYYLRLPYTVILRSDEEDDFVARIDELPGCIAHGETRHEALERLDEAKALWITDRIESGDTVPEPVIEETLPSGKWVQRVPRSLHQKLISAAKHEGVSLNQLVTSVLSEAVGVRKAREIETRHAGKSKRRERYTLDEVLEVAARLRTWEQNRDAWETAVELLIKKAKAETAEKS